MRHAMANRRRNRQGGGGGGGHHRPQHNKATVFDSNGPDVRIRGTAFQIVEKYMALAKDATSSGDRVLAENYLQHAEHYQRLIGSWVEEAPRASYYNDTQGSQNAAQAGDEQPQPDVVVTRPSQQKVEDDLSLPASILGVSPQASSEGSVREVRTVVAG